jgi:hypothetical protein
MGSGSASPNLVLNVIPVGDCAVRVRNMEHRLDKITDPLDSMSNDELQRILYILELIKKDQGRKRKARRAT